MKLVDYVIAHTKRGECKCGSCCDVGNKPDPSHSVDMVFFKCAATDQPQAGAFRELTSAHKGEFCSINPFDGKEHSYIELGGWIGDQGLAMQYMALGVALGLFTLLSPAMLGLEGKLAMEMAGKGLLSIQAHPTPKSEVAK